MCLRVCCSGFGNGTRTDARSLISLEFKVVRNSTLMAALGGSDPRLGRDAKISEMARFPKGMLR